MDISSMSDEELLKLVGGSQPSTKPQDSSSVSSMSDEELLKIAGIEAPVKETKPLSSEYTSELKTQMEQEKSVKAKKIAEAKELIKTDPAAGNQALRDAMRLGIATEGQVSSDLKQAQEYVATKGKPATTYEGKTLKLGDVNEAGLIDTSVDVLAPTGKVIGSGISSKVSLGTDQVISEILRGVQGINGQVSKGTEYLINRIVAGLPEGEAATKSTEIVQLVSSLPEDLQAYALANMAEGKMGFDNIRKAISNAKDSSNLQATLNNSLRGRGKMVLDSPLGNSDINLAQQKWSEMLSKVEQVAPQQVSTESFKNSLDYVSNIYGLEGTSKASQIVRQIKADTSEPLLSASQALNVRKGINELIRKAPSGSREITELNNIKSSLDSFIKSTLPKDVNDMVEETIANYARVANNSQFIEIVKKNTAQGIGTDWAKVLKDAKSDGLKSEEITHAVNIAKEFEKKFKYDKQLSSTAVPSGVDEASGGLLWFSTQVANNIRDVFSPIYNRTRHENLVIQNEIVKAIKQGTNVTDVITGLSRNTNIPEEVRVGVFGKLSEDLVSHDLPTGATINDVMNVNSIAHANPTESSTNSVRAITSSDTIDEAIQTSESTGRSVNEVVQELNNKVKEEPSEFVRNLIGGRPEQLLTYDETVSKLSDQGFRIGSTTNDAGRVTNFAIHSNGDIFKIEYLDDNTYLRKLPDTSAGLMRNIELQSPATLEQIRQSSVVPIQGDEVKSSLEHLIGKNIVGTRYGVPIGTTLTDISSSITNSGMTVKLHGTAGDVNFRAYKRPNGQYGFDSTHIPQGGNLAYDLNKVGWDYINSIGEKYYPDTILTNANPFRLGLNMLKYANERGWDNVKFIHIRENMYGYSPTSGYSNRSRLTKPLTKQNLAKFNLELINGIVKDKLGIGRGVSLKTMPEDKLTSLLEGKLPGRNELSLTKNSVRDLMKFMKDHSPETMFGIVPILPLFDTKSAEANSNIGHDAVKNYFSSIESGGDYNAVNASGAYGKYQIHPVMMKELGISKAYLKNPDNQEKVMDSLIPKYESRLKKFDIPVTKENMFVIHNLGSSGGVRVLTGRYTKEDIKNMASNLPEDLRGDDNTIVTNYSTKYKIEIPKRAV